MWPSGHFLASFSRWRWRRREQAFGGFSWGHKGGCRGIFYDRSIMVVLLGFGPAPLSRPLIESQSHQWHYWLDRLASGSRGLESLSRSCHAVTAWPIPTGDGQPSFDRLHRDSADIYVQLTSTLTHNCPRHWFHGGTDCFLLWRDPRL